MERRRIVSWENPDESRRNPALTTGLDYLRSIKDGRVAPPPVANLLGYRIVDVDQGRAVFELEPAEYHYNPFSTVHGGITSTLLDTSMTAAVLSTLKENFACATIEIKVNFIRPISGRTDLIQM